MRPVKYDPFQLQAIEAIEQGKSVLVSAPTGSGKTAIAEFAIERALARNERVVYTAPVKALSNQKFRDFSLKYPGKVGLLTGDVSLDPDMPLVIMTTEIFRNKLFEDPEKLKSTTLVIFDEVHYLDDFERGTVWEESIMFCPEHIRLIALSATAPNIQEMADWIQSILHHPIEVIIETKRSVPLEHFFQCQGTIYNNTSTLKKDGYMNHEIWPSNFGGGRRERMHQNFSKKRFDRFLRARPNRTEELIRHLKDQGRLPCIYFGFGRKRVEELAWEMKFDFLKDSEREEITALYHKLCEKYDLLKESSAIDMQKLVSRGIAFHHAGMLPTLKEVIEQLFTSKKIKLIFTTETFAIGINMPAKTVAFDELRKFYGTHFGNLRTRDFYQMAGRAGRRGMDTVGYVYSRVNPHDAPFPVLIRMIFGQPEPIESQFNSCYATLLNLYNQFGSKLLDIYPRSFHYFQSNRKGRIKGAAMIERKISLLTEMGYMSGETLTPKGEFASWMYGYELILSEMLEEGYLETLNEVKLSALLLALVFEPRKNQQCGELPYNLRGIDKKAYGFLRNIHALEDKHKVWPLTKMPYFHLTEAVEAWLGGCLFHELGRHTDVDEGEIIRYFRMVIQLLRQLKHAPKVGQNLKSAATTAYSKINRDLIDAEKQLRNL